MPGFLEKYLDEIRNKIEKGKSNGLGECGDHVLDGCLKKIVDEKSSFGNGWRFFYALKERGDRLWREYVRQGQTGQWRAEG